MTMQNWEIVKPNDVYEVCQSSKLTEEGRESLIHLYQPIIGPAAFSLYFSLLGDAQDQSVRRWMHLDCFSTQNYGVAGFLEARKRLEGIGLLKVFKKTDENLEISYVYQLEEPLAPTVFMKEVVYTFLLWEKVGERKFEQLRRRFQPFKKEMTDYEEVTASFSEVYGALNIASFQQKSNHLDRVVQDYEVKTNKVVLSKGTLDWKFLISFAKKQYISEENFTETFKEQLLYYHERYGLDELELISWMSRVTSVREGRVDSYQLAQLLRENFFIKREEIPQAITENQEKKVQVTNEMVTTDGERSLLESSEQLMPLDFLYGIKQAKKSYATASEERIIRTLMEKSPLPSSVLNILIHYVLVVENNSMLKENFVNTLATDWSELGIKTPKEAIERVRSHRAATKQKYKNAVVPKKASAKKVIRKEVLPEWAKQAQVPVEEENQERQAEIEKRLKAYYAGNEGES